MKSTIDHIIFMVRDLPRSIEHYKILLGRKPSAQGSHPAFKTKNAVFRLENTYLELLADDQETIEKGTPTFVSEHISRHGTGLAGISFGTTDAATMVTHMQKHGIAAGMMPAQGHNDVTGTVRHWLNVFWPNTAARGLWTFGIQYLDPLDKLPIAPEESPSDTNVTAVDHVVINTNDGSAAKKFYGDTLGIRLALELPSHPLGHLMFFKTNNTTLEVKVSKDHLEDEDHFLGISYQTINVDATHDRLVKAGVEVSEVRTGMKPGTRVCTVKSHNLEVPTLLIGPDPSKSRNKL